MRIYLAGPEVFMPNAREIGQRKQQICKIHGHQGLYPLDNEITAAAAGDLAKLIFDGNYKMLVDADTVVANLTPFRGVSADVGTVLEVGCALALGLPVYGYSHDASTLLDRVLADAGGLAETGIVSADGRRYAADGFAVEAFGLSDNLMIEKAIAASGGQFFKAAAGDAHRWNDLGLFEMCLIAMTSAENKIRARQAHA